VVGDRVRTWSGDPPQSAWRYDDVCGRRTAAYVIDVSYRSMQHRERYIEHARQRLHLLELPGRERNEKASEATAALALRDFVEDMKASGFVADALARCGIAGASVAPACGSGTSSSHHDRQTQRPVVCRRSDESPSFERI